MLEKIKNNEMDGLIEILDVKLKLLQDIYDLTCKQRERLNSGEIDEFIKIIEKRDLRIKKINELDERYNNGLKKVKDMYDINDLSEIKGSQEILALQENIQKILRDIYACDKLNIEKFSVEFDKVRANMVNSKKNKKVTSSYYQVPTQVGGYFIDKKR